MIRNRDRKCGLCTKQKQLSGNRNVQKMKKKEGHTTNGSRSSRVQEEAQTQQQLLLIGKTSHSKAALQQENLQWTGDNELLSREEIIRLDAQERAHNNAACGTDNCCARNVLQHIC
jgi:hypothetical protein